MSIHISGLQFDSLCHVIVIDNKYELLGYYISTKLGRCVNNTENKVKSSQ